MVMVGQVVVMLVTGVRQGVDRGRVDWVLTGGGVNGAAAGRSR